jgi:hypothetical protein
VWIGDNYGKSRTRIQTVARLTKTQIILDGYYTGGAASEFNRYQRGKETKLKGLLTYRRIKGGGNSITAVATPEECAEWDAAQEKKAWEDAAVKARRGLIEAKQRELSELFGENGGVQHAGRNTLGEWEVSLYLSEDGVRRLAELISTNNVTKR